jgi:serine/threonine protein kinase
MKPISDRTVDRLLQAAELPDLSDTRYRMVGKLGCGGMGTVYLVEDDELKRQVALKVLSDPAPAQALSDRLLREARHLARLEHPNIVPVHDAGRLSDGRAYYVMKYVRGQQLDSWRLENPTRSALLRMFRNICEAVAFAHAQGVIHRDLKPQNIMVGSFGEALIMDFGVAKALGGVTPDAGEMPQEAVRQQDAGATAAGAVLGTPGYMAPEQARGEVDALDQRTDVYALGAILCFLLSGRTDPPGDPGTPRALRSICRKATAERPEDRYPGADDLARDVDSFLDGRPVGAHREGLWEVAGRLLARNHVLVLLILSYLVMRMLVLFFFGR